MSLDFFGGHGGSKARDYVAITVHQKLREVPFDFAAKKAALLLFQVSVQRMLALAVDLDFGKLREGHVVIQPAEADDLSLGAGSLIAELVAGEVEDLKPLGLIFS